MLFRFNKTVLLIFSLIFYAWGEPIFIPLMLTMVVVNHRLGLKIETAAAGDKGERDVGS
jgi:alginate O-acetyltransferase complex protein AlgI